MNYIHKDGKTIGYEVGGKAYYYTTPITSYL